MTSILLLVLLPTPLATGALPRALEQAAIQALGGDASVELRGYELAPDDDQARATARGRGAQAVAVLRVHPDVPDRIAVRVLLVGEARASMQVMDFSGSDPLAERGRTLGLVIGALVPGRHVPVAEPVVAPAAAASAAVTPAAPVAAAYALWAAGAAGIGVNGTGPGAGIDLALLRRLGKPAVRIGATARTGEVAAAKASSLALDLGLGVVYPLLAMDSDARLGLDVRADVRLGPQILSHFSDDDPAPVRQVRIAPLFDVLLETRWRLTRSLRLVAAAGVELPFARRVVSVRGAPVATLAPVVASFELGLETVF